jgi:hypothetical protein
MRSSRWNHHTAALSEVRERAREPELAVSVSAFYALIKKNGIIRQNANKAEVMGRESADLRMNLDTGGREKEKLMGMQCGMERRIMQLQQQLATINQEKEIIIRNHAGKGEATHGARA